MDRFLEPSVPRPPDAAPKPGFLVYGYSDFAENGMYGFKGVLDPTFAGLPVTASSPLECNSKATSYALDYNKYAKIKYDDAMAKAKYDKDMAFYDMSVKGGFNPVQPMRPVYQLSLYAASAILFFDQIETQTMRCSSEGACGPSSGQRRAFMTEDRIWVYEEVKDLAAAPIPSIQDVTWSFIADAAAAPFGRQCQIHFRPAQRTREVLFQDGKNASVTGVGNSDCGAQTLATVPYIRDGCAPSRVDMPQAKECTVLAEDHGRIGPTDGWSWYTDGLPDDGTLSKTTTVLDICARYPLLQECECIAREERPNFNLFKANFSSTSEVCWYLPCSRTGYDRLVTPAEADARLHCDPNVCQSITNVVNSEKVDLKDVQNTINCSTAQYEEGMKKAADKEAGGGVVAGVTDKINSIASGLGTETIVAIVVVVFVVILMLLAAWLYFSSSSSRPVPAVAAAAAPVEPRPVVAAATPAAK